METAIELEIPDVFHNTEQYATDVIVNPFGRFLGLPVGDHYFVGVFLLFRT